MEELFILTGSNIFESPEIKYIHFVGIGGISMSGLAEILMRFGYKISGSDLKASKLTKKLEQMGVKIYISHDESNIKNPDLVVYTAAVKQDNPELIRARALNVPIMDRATLLGQIMEKYPYSIAISGTHGKTTTTSMITTIMMEAGLDPTVHIGGELQSIGGSTRIGGNKYFITEACEYVESFLKFHPFLAVILNIDLDHVDYFKDLEHIKSAFLKFASLVPDNGCVVACADDPGTSWLLDKLTCNKITYGLKSENALWSAKDIVFNDMGCATFSLTRNDEKIDTIALNIPGIHNVNNALAAIAACHAFGCGISQIKEGLRKFTGASRRFELKGIVDGIKVIDDYAHHPSEVKATLKAAKNCRHSKIWCVFQPHTYTRTKSFLEDFSNSFSDADSIIVSDIYAAREIDRGEIHARALCERLSSKGKKAVYISGFENIAAYLENHASTGDIIITMGAGDIYKVGEIFLEHKKIAAAI
ncbi:MAG: UDP-N-acetylmuramate--L-alanine ligase [Clostridiales bacterium]|jgi:UDP-N-acetylmuramate--alanine ligase|nr:UDP-N-acetylmuramate--L-alanine ligase [Eubacteriales bacterium]MDH7567029.1 UDP-N-acetylmuramate--L-alanine ligase [Clostridiales bacterium]